MEGSKFENNNTLNYLSLFEGDTDGDCVVNVGEYVVVCISDMLYTVPSRRKFVAWISV